MLFNSVQFFIFFIFVLLIITSIRKNNYRHLFLLFSSYYFYWVSSNYFFVLLLFTSLITFYSGEEIYKTTDHKKKKYFLFLALASTLGILGFFKYFNFAIDTIDQSAQMFNVHLPIHTLNILLPVGISFFTFQGLSYVFDIYKGKLEPVDSFYKYALFVAFFPQLVAGPIVRASHFLPQLKNNVGIIPDNLKFGITLIAWGLIKKVIIADNIGPTADIVFSYPTGFSSIYIMAATFLFGIQIYCDFSGYSDIAIGSAKIMGFNLPQNFDRPYFTKNPSEFWRKWHISLSSFIKDYLYIPIGGNRKGKIRTYVNLMVAMLLTGLWHGAAWNFVIWGGYHGILLMVHKIISKGNYLKNSMISNTRIESLLSLIVTQYFVFLGWLIFRVENFDDLVYCINKFIFIDFIFDLDPKIELTFAGSFLLLTVASMKTKASGRIVNFLSNDWISYISSLKLKQWMYFLIVTMLLLLIFSPSRSPEFIYFQF